MLYLVHTHISIPPGTEEALVKQLRASEKEHSADLQRKGICRHLWRVAGKTASYAVFDVDSHDAIHAVLTSFPLYSFMTTVEVTPLSRHPAAIA
jgi:muconolactone D-isomerase